MKSSKDRFRSVLFINLIFFFIYNFATEGNIIPFVYNIVPVAKDLQLQKTISQCRCIILPLIIAVTIYCNQKKLIENIVNHPIIFMLGSCFLSNCIIDAISKYRQINQTLEFFLFSQTMSRYLFCILAIKNSMTRLDQMKILKFNEQEFFSMVTKETGYTIQELEIFTFELLNSSINSIKNLCIDINTTDLEEKIYFLFKEQVTLEQMLLICKDDVALYSELMKFHDNPEKEYVEVMQRLCALIHEYFNCFMKKKFQIA